MHKRTHARFHGGLQLRNSGIAWLASENAER
jgi:hypothetical protein